VVRAWGLSIVEVVIGLTIVAMALRESIPGRALAKGTVVTAILGGIATPMLSLLITSERFDIGVPPRAQLYASYICFRTSLGAAVPALLVSDGAGGTSLPLAAGRRRPVVWIGMRRNRRRGSPSLLRIHHAVARHRRARWTVVAAMIVGTAAGIGGATTLTGNGAVYSAAMNGYL
jgi:hypothetical protein